LLVSVAYAVLYRYADFVTYLGGSELHLGWIVGLGMVGSLLMRIFLGTAVDRYGSRLLWLGGLLVFTASCFGHLLITRYDGVAIYLLRIALCSAIACVFGASMTFISGRAPVVRMAEMLGMLGTSGFLGMVLGAQLGDLLVHGSLQDRMQVDRLFLASGVLALLALAAAWWATWSYQPPVPRRRPPLLWLLRRYSPGSVLLVSVAMGFGFGLPQTFLRTYAAELGIPRIGLFFAIYSGTAIITRVVTRRLPERIGLQPMILFGLVMLVAGQVLFLAVGTEWQLLIPAISFGISHAILFPTAVAEACGTFPARYRGLATMLILAAYDLGVLIGSPIAGVVLHVADAMGLPSYPVMYLTVAALLGAMGLVYVLTRRRGPKTSALRTASLAAGSHKRPRRRSTFPQADGSSRSTAAVPHKSRPEARSPSECGPC
jgi:MFS family permease